MINGLWMTFLRVLALVHIAATITVWAYVMGFPIAGLTPFLDVPMSARAATTVLCVLYPLSAIGLWTTHAGGQVIWALTAAFQVVALLSGWIGPLAPWWLLQAVLGSLALYVLLAALRGWMVRKAWTDSVNAT